MRLDEFRTSRDSGHPTYLYESNDKKIKTKGITHSRHTFGKENQPLKNNPDPHDNSQAYFLPKTKIVKSKQLKKQEKYKNWRLSKEDKIQYIDIYFK